MTKIGAVRRDATQKEHIIFVMLGGVFLLAAQNVFAVRLRGTCTTDLWDSEDFPSVRSVVLIAVRRTRGAGPMSIIQAAFDKAVW